MTAELLVILDIWRFETVREDVGGGGGGVGAGGEVVVTVTVTLRVVAPPSPVQERV